MSKLIRISEDAHKAAKIAAATLGMPLEGWASLALLQLGASVLKANADAAVATMNGLREEQRS